MTTKEPIFSGIVQCVHCRNSSAMEILYAYSRVQDKEYDRGQIMWEEGDVHEVLLCQVCGGVTLRKYYWHSFDDPPCSAIEVLYPSPDKIPIGLPESIKKAYEAALDVKRINPNAYAVLLRRLLELVCEDRNASGRDLFEKLQYLNQQGEIPNNLAGAGHGLRDLGNVGAHATLGELTEGEVPIIESLADAILNYVYTAPYLVERAQKRIDAMKAKRSRGEKGD